MGKDEGGQMTHASCNRCFDPMENKNGLCVFAVYTPAPDPSVPEKEDGTMSKGILFTQAGRLFKATTPEAKATLKSVIEGKPVAFTDAKEIGPVINLDTLDVAGAREKYMELEGIGE